MIGEVPSERGQAAVVVPVPAVEPVVSGWRARFDRSAAQGMPAHVTALYPFLPENRLSGDVLAELGELCAKSPALDVRFRRTARFPDVLYLDPEPADGLRHLTLALAECWPQAPPYGGVFDGVIPHLTVAHGASDAMMDQIEADVTRGLPVSTRLMEACLFIFDGERWRLQVRLPFQDRRSLSGSPT